MRTPVGTSWSLPPDVVSGDEDAGPDGRHGPDRVLVEVFRSAQRRGDLGSRSIDWVIEHSREFVRALDGVTGRVVDLGSGAGVPGLVVAVDRPDLDVVLVERRRHRADRLELARGRLRLDNVSVQCVDASGLLRDEPSSFDGVTARSFASPDRTLQIAAGLVRPGGRIVISEPPPEIERWDEWIDEAGLGVEMVSRGRVVVFESGTQAS